MARIQLKIWRAPLATLQANLAEGEVGIASETNTFYKRPDGAATGALIPIGGGGGVATMRAKVATTGNIALTGLQTIDGITLTAGDFVLVSSQTNPAQNGVYVAAAGAWVRAAGADAWTNLINAIYVVEQGITLADTIWMCTSDTGGTLGTTAVTFQAVNNKTGAVLASVTPSADALPYFTGSGTATTTTLTAYARTLLDDADAATMLNTLGAQPVDADLTALATMSTTGMLVRTGNGTAASRRLAVSGTGLSISNADGVAGNPTVTSNATSANTASAVVARDASGNFSAGTITAALTGNATSANKLSTARTLSISGDATGSATFDGSADKAIALTLANSGVIAGTYSTVTVDAKGRVTAATNAGGSMTGGTITSSTIDSTAIGATTPSTGKFTTLTTIGAGTIGGDLTINGNFTVNGTTTTINSTVISVDDPVFNLGGDTASTVDDNKDRGIQFQWHNGTSAKVGFFGFDDSTGRFTFIPDATNTAEVFGGAVGTIDANLTGIVTAASGSTSVTPALSSNDTTIATTAFVRAIVGFPDSDIGTPGQAGFGQGICPNPPAGMFEMSGTRDPYSDNYGNYHFQDGSVMVWVPAFYYRIGNAGNPTYGAYGVNSVDVKGFNAFDTIAAANAAGYALHRAFYDNGQVQAGFFVDKYLASNNGGVASSVKNGLPLSSSSIRNPFSSLNGAPANFYYGAIAAAKTRGSNFFPSSLFINKALAMLSLAHAQASTSTAYCAWYDASGVTNFPKGCNNNALGDSNDAALTFVSDGNTTYPTASKTGSANVIAKTTHNGQNCGVVDLNGCMWEICLGLTSDGTNFYVMKTAVAMKSVTAGNTSATDAWGAAGIAALYTSVGATYGAVTASSTYKVVGSAGQVLDASTSGNNWAMTGGGVPLTSGGSNQFGNDGLWDWRINELCPVAGGTWSNGSLSGVWALFLSNVRSDSSGHVGFRAALYL